jgi:hypothetical protein
MAKVSKEQERAIKQYLSNSKNFIEYDGVKIIDQTEFGKFIAKLFNLPDDVSDKPGMNKVGFLKKQNAELFDGYEIRKGNIFKRDKPLIQALNNDPIFRDEVNKKLKALNKKDFFNLTKDQQNTIVGTTKKIKQDLQKLPKNYISKPELAKKLNISEAAIEAYGLGKHALIGEKYRELFKPVVLKNRGTFYDSTNIDKKINKFKDFTDRPMLHKTSVARANLLASNPEIQNLLETKDKSLFNTDEGLKKALKVLGKGSTPHEAAHAITVLARAYNGEKFRGLDIKPNKTKGKFIINNIAKLQYDNPWTTGLYDEGLRQVDRDLGNRVNTFKNFKVAYRDKLQNLLKEYGIKEKFNINEITSVKASANNKIAPYAAFVDITQADINQKALSGFQGDLSKTLSYIDKNKNNQAKILEKIENFNTGTRKKRMDNLVKEFGEGAKDVRFAEIVPGTNVESVYAKGDLDRWKTKGLDLQKLADEKGYFLDVKGARPYFDVTEKDLKKSVNNLIESTDELSKPLQLKLCSLLSNGGLPGDCKQAIEKNPEKAAKILSEAPVTSAAMNNVKKDSQKLIRLFRGEEPARKTELYKAGKGTPGMYEESLKGRFFFDNPADARYYAQRQGTLTGNVKSVDVPENMVNIGKKMADRRRGPNYSSEVILPKKFVGQETVNIPQTAMARAGAIVDKIKSGVKYNKDAGTFVNTTTNTPDTNFNAKTYAQDNPIEVKAGTEDALKPIKGNLLKTVGKSLAYVGAPLPTALIDSYFVGKQISEDRPAAEIAKDPLNWLGLATMSTLSEISGVSKPGKVNAALRLGMSPGLIRGVSRFAGIPGLAISTALTAYDQYNKYKNEEGLIYNLFNKKTETIA